MSSTIFMKKALELGRQNLSTKDGGPFGAVIVQDGMMISEGKNQVIQFQDPTAHAEIVAIRQACKKLKTFDLSACEIYSSCEPCPMCLGAIYWAKIKKIFYAASRQDASNIGFDDALIYSELNKPLQKRKLKIKQILHHEALLLFNEWKQKPDKVFY